MKLLCATLAWLVCCCIGYAHMVPLQVHFTKNNGGRCGWACIDSMFRHNGFRNLDGVAMREGEGGNLARFRDFVRWANVPHDIYWFERVTESRFEHIRRAVDGNFCCMVAVGPINDAHAVVIVGMDNNMIHYVDPNDPEWIVKTTREGLRWNGFILTIYPTERQRQIWRIE